MTVEEILELMDELLDKSSSVPFSQKKMIDVEQMREYIDSIRLNLPGEIKRAKDMTRDKKNILTEANKEAEEIVKKLNERTGCKVTLHDYSDPEILRQSIADSAILVNGTSVGMAPKTDNTIITDTTMFHKDLFVFDVIYNPQETRLLREAKEAGCKTGNGMYMLLYQGAASFKLWTGEDMPVEIIKEKYFSGK